LVLSTLDNKVVEVSDTGLSLNKPTLFVTLLRDNSILQVLPKSIKHVKPDHSKNE